jgi:hypothetical protein
MWEDERVARLCERVLLCDPGRRCQTYSLAVAPGARLPPFPHLWMEEGSVTQGDSLSFGTAFRVGHRLRGRRFAARWVGK